MKIKIFSDGGARGNPGPAGIGCVIQKSKCKNIELSRYIGTATNNQAEYQAVIEALKWLKENVIACHSERSEESLANASTSKTSSEILRLTAQDDTNDNLEIEFYLDSQLVVEQLNQRYKLKNEGLKPLFWHIRDLVLQLGGKVTFAHIPREQNKEADRLVNIAIDKKELTKK